MANRRSTTRGKRTKARQKKRSKRQANKLHVHLTPEKQLDLVGYTLLCVAGLTLLSFLSANHGAVPRWWLGVLRLTVGWGAYAIPLLLGTAGLWIVLRNHEDAMPRPRPRQAVGTLLGYVGLLITVHLLISKWSFAGDLWAAAEVGDGGGSVGASLGHLLRYGLGIPGTIIALVTWWIISVGLTFDFTVKDAVQAIRPWLVRLRKQGEAALANSRGREIEASQVRLPLEDAVLRPELGEVVINTPSPPAQTQAGLSGTSPVQVVSGKSAWRPPSFREILRNGGGQDLSAEVLRQQAKIIEETLASLDAPVRVVEINQGPVVTQFGVSPLVVKGRNGRETKVKVSRISSVADDLALALEARTLRVEAPIPGKRLVGIEVPNPESALVSLRDVMESQAFARVDSTLRLCLGQDVSGGPVVTDLAAMPHLLIAGTTGSGKSVCINAIIAALLLQNTPDDLRLIMVDPKRVELTGYDGIPHLLSEVVVDMKRAASTLQWVQREMNSRYRRFARTGALQIRDYNERVASENGEKKLPYIVVVVDELADVMMMSPHETERSICRIAQMARATGIHLVVATQRPSVDVVTGLIKANFPARIAFNVASSVDSRVIIDTPGAEQLLGKGDLLFLPPDASTPLRLQGVYVSDEELRKLVRYWKGQSVPESQIQAVPSQQTLWDELPEAKPQAKLEDELLPDVIDILVRQKKASISMLQRKLRIGYTRAARLMDVLEEHGVVGPQPEGSKRREVNVAAAQALLAGWADGSEAATA
jgi:S-DNA-T family DNA segregation ATPase FtsK/SpoIIIE